MELSPDQVQAFVDRVRQFDVKEGMTDPDSGSDAADDGMTDVLQDDPANDSVTLELRGFLAALNVDQQAELVALAWIGRGDFEPGELQEAVTLAHERSRDRGIARYLLGIPNVGDLVNEGWAALGEETGLRGDSVRP